MRTLKTFQYDQNLNMNGFYRHRKASRAIIQASSQYLMIYSKVNEEFKFPGGGVKRGETLTQALLREVKEECGISTVNIDHEFGKIIEIRRPYEIRFDVFRMVSYYYLCSLPQKFTQHALDLDDYEIDLGFTPTWVDIQSALAQNQLVLQRDPERIPRWTKRDTYILELLYSKEMK